MLRDAVLTGRSSAGSDFILLKNMKLHPEELCAAKRLEGSMTAIATAVQKSLNRARAALFTGSPDCPFYGQPGLPGSARL
jgi:hypothetical protein